MYSVIPFSGGLDSSILLLQETANIAALCSGNMNGWPHSHITALSFDYGQRNVIELKYAKAFVRWINRTFVMRQNIRHVVVPVADVMRVVAPCLMTRKTGKFAYDTIDAPTSFVPGRNAMFLSLALSYAVTSRRASKHPTMAAQVLMGFNQSDIGMPDTTKDFMGSFRDAWCKGLPDNEVPPRVRAPFKELTKVEMFRKAQWFHANNTTPEEISKRLIRGTMSCHYGIETLNEWGRGCGKCAPCEWRKGIK